MPSETTEPDIAKVLGKQKGVTRNTLFLINSLIHVRAMVSMQKSGDTLQELLLSYRVRPVGHPLVVRFGGKCLYSPNHLVGKSVWFSKETLY